MDYGSVVQGVNLIFKSFITGIDCLQAILQISALSCHLCHKKGIQITKRVVTVLCRCGRNEIATVLPKRAIFPIDSTPIVFVNGQYVIVICPVETIKSEELQNKVFKVTSCQILLFVCFNWGRRFSFYLSLAKCMIFYVAGTHSVIMMSSQGEEMVKTVVCKFWEDRFQAEGDVCIH